MNHLPNINLRTTFERRLTCAEYFAGIGLVRLGLEQMGWQVIFANDWEKEKFKMYSAHFTDAEQHYKVQDIFSICPQDIPPTLLATASFPCVDLSLAGNLKGIDGKHSSAFWGFTQILESQINKPFFILLENVTGWLTSNHGQDFRIVIQELNRLGYVCDVYTIDAVHFVPQSRPRIFVIGMYATSSNQDILTFTQRSASLKSKTLEKVILDNQDLRWHFLEVPDLPAKVNLNVSCIVEKMQDQDKRWWSHDEIRRHLRMMSSMNIKYLSSRKNSSKLVYCTMYRRVRNGRQWAELRKDGIAGCLRTARGGSSRQMLVRIGKGRIKMRWMTPREYARLQGVPDHYPITIEDNQALTGFGDAVCVPVIRWIAEHIFTQLISLKPEERLAVHY